MFAITPARLGRSLAKLVGGVSLVALASGCEPHGGTSLVHVFSTHHGTPSEGAFPNLGEPDMPRVFETNEGWEVTLVHSYVTTTAVSLVSCEGEEVPLRMFWGPCPEDLHLEDLRAFTVAGLEVPSGYYCQLLVQYGPYVLPTELEREEEARHDVPDDEEIANATTYIRGAAKRPGDVDNIPFEIRSKAKFVVAMDLDDFSADDEPFYVDGTEDLPLELTVSKMYDRFFDDLDFSAIEGSELNSAVNGALRRQTRAWPGSKISETASQ